jgi:hypothetical protein
VVEWWWNLFPIFLLRRKTMKKLFALILALVMCLGLCACGSSEYVGEYEGTNNYEKRTLSVKSNGKYILEFDRGSANGTDFINEECGTWEEVDGYVVFKTASYTVKQYSTESGELLSTKSSDLNDLDGKQFELKGTYLYETISDSLGFQKVS